MDEDETPLDPQTEQELRETMDQAGRSARDDGMLEMGRYVRRQYMIFRAQGFSRRQSFQMASYLYQVLLMRGAQ